MYDGFIYICIWLRSHRITGSESLQTTFTFSTTLKCYNFDIWVHENIVYLKQIWPCERFSQAAVRMPQHNLVVFIGTALVYLVFVWLLVHKYESGVWLEAELSTPSGLTTIMQNRVAEHPTSPLLGPYKRQRLLFGFSSRGRGKGDQR